MIDLKGELANSKAGQAAIKQAVDTAAKEHGASIAREKSLKVYAGPACCLCIASNCPESLMPCYAIFLDHLHLQRFLPQTCGLHVMQGVVPVPVFRKFAAGHTWRSLAAPVSLSLYTDCKVLAFVQTPTLRVRTM